jgi:hypothetical protein
MLNNSKLHYHQNKSAIACIHGCWNNMYIVYCPEKIHSNITNIRCAPTPRAMLCKIKGRRRKRMEKFN